MADGNERSMKRSKRNQPKVRTGCITCKIRRVKCDESKPTCNRCANFGVACDGYIRSASTASATKRLLPKARGPNSHPDTVVRQPSRLRFFNEEEHCYFQIFCHQTVVHLSGLFCSTAWHSLVLQACETQPSIRHTVVALGAVTPDRSSDSVEQSNEAMTLRRHFAFRQYSVAIAQIRRQVMGRKVGIPGGMPDLRTTIIACLLFVCFEIFNCDVESAITQVYAGARMIEWFLRPSQDSDHVRSLVSPRPTVIVSELIQLFGRMELQAMSLRDSRSTEVHRSHRLCGQISIDSMPEAFADLTEARVYLELVMRRAMHWLASITLKERYPGVWGGLTNGDFENIANICSERNKVLLDYEKWHRAFRPVWLYSRTENGRRNYFGATALRLQWLASYICKSIVGASSEIYYGRFTKELREIGTLSRIVLSSPYSGPPLSNSGSNLDTEPSFTFDVQVIFPLTAVAGKFRHRRLRREAIAILLENPRREGIWDARVAGRSMQWLADIEDEGLGDEDPEHVPEDSVVKLVKMDFDQVAKTTTVTCLPPVRGGEPETVRREIVIKWLEPLLRNPS